MELASMEMEAELSLAQALEQLAQDCAPSPDDYDLRMRVINQVTESLHRLPGMENTCAAPFGSFVSQFYTSSSDLDLVLCGSLPTYLLSAAALADVFGPNQQRSSHVPLHLLDRGTRESLLRQAAAQLVADGVARAEGVQHLLRARVPLVKLDLTPQPPAPPPSPQQGYGAQQRAGWQGQGQGRRRSASPGPDGGRAGRGGAGPGGAAGAVAGVPAPQLRVDLSVGSPSAGFKAWSLAQLASIHPAVTPLLRLVKLWARNAGINDGASHTLNSWALALLVVAYLQTAPAGGPPLLPPLCELLSDEPPPPGAPRLMQMGEEVSVQVYEEVAARAAAAREVYGRRPCPPLDELLGDCLASTGALLAACAEGPEAPSCGWRISVFRGRLLPPPRPFASDYVLSVEDPYDDTDNTARTLGTWHNPPGTIAAILAAFRAAARALGVPDPFDPAGAADGPDGPLARVSEPGAAADGAGAAPRTRRAAAAATGAEPGAEVEEEEEETDEAEDEEAPTCGFGSSMSMGGGAFLGASLGVSLGASLHVGPRFGASPIPGPSCLGGGPGRNPAAARRAAAASGTGYGRAEGVAVTMLQLFGGGLLARSPRLAAALLGREAAARALAEVERGEPAEAVAAQLLQRLAAPPAGVQRVAAAEPVVTPTAPAQIPAEPRAVAGLVAAREAAASPYGQSPADRPSPLSGPTPPTALAPRPHLPGGTAGAAPAPAAETRVPPPDAVTGFETAVPAPPPEPLKAPAEAPAAAPAAVLAAASAPMPAAPAPVVPGVEAAASTAVPAAAGTTADAAAAPAQAAEAARAVTAPVLSPASAAPPRLRHVATSASQPQPQPQPPPGPAPAPEPPCASDRGTPQRTKDEGAAERSGRTARSSRDASGGSSTGGGAASTGAKEANGRRGTGGGGSNGGAASASACSTPAANHGKSGGRRASQDAHTSPTPKGSAGGGGGGGVQAAGSEGWAATVAEAEAAAAAAEAVAAGRGSSSRARDDAAHAAANAAAAAVAAAGATAGKTPRAAGAAQESAASASRTVSAAGAPVPTSSGMPAAAPAAAFAASCAEAEAEAAMPSTSPDCDIAQLSAAAADPGTDAGLACPEEQGSLLYVAPGAAAAATAMDAFPPGCGASPERPLVLRLGLGLGPSTSPPPAPLSPPAPHPPPPRRSWAQALLSRLLGPPAAPGKPTPPPPLQPLAHARSKATESTQSPGAGLEDPKAEVDVAEREAAPEALPEPAPTAEAPPSGLGPAAQASPSAADEQGVAVDLPEAATDGGPAVSPVPMPGAPLDATLWLQPARRSRASLVSPAYPRGLTLHRDSGQAAAGDADRGSQLSASPDGLLLVRRLLDTPVRWPLLGPPSARGASHGQPRAQAQEAQLPEAVHGDGPAARAVGTADEPEEADVGAARERPWWPMPPQLVPWAGAYAGWAGYGAGAGAGAAAGGPWAQLWPPFVWPGPMATLQPPPPPPPPPRQRGRRASRTAHAAAPARAGEAAASGGGGGLGLAAVGCVIQLACGACISVGRDGGASIALGSGAVIALTADGGATLTLGGPGGGGGGGSADGGGSRVAITPTGALVTLGPAGGGATIAIGAEAPDLGPAQPGTTARPEAAAAAGAATAAAPDAPMAAARPEAASAPPATDVGRPNASPAAEVSPPKPHLTVDMAAASAAAAAAVEEAASAAARAEPPPAPAPAPHTERAEPAATVHRLPAHPKPQQCRSRSRKRRSTGSVPSGRSPGREESSAPAVPAASPLPSARGQAPPQPPPTPSPCAGPPGEEPAQPQPGVKDPPQAPALPQPSGAPPVAVAVVAPPAAKSSPQHSPTAPPQAPSPTRQPQAAKPTPVTQATQGAEGSRSPGAGKAAAGPGAGPGLGAADGTYIAAVSTAGSSPEAGADGARVTTPTSAAAAAAARAATERLPLVPYRASVSPNGRTAAAADTRHSSPESAEKPPAPLATPAASASPAAPLTEQVTGGSRTGAAEAAPSNRRARAAAPPQGEVARQMEGALATKLLQQRAIMNHLEGRVRAKAGQQGPAPGPGAAPPGTGSLPSLPHQAASAPQLAAPASAPAGGSTSIAAVGVGADADEGACVAAMASAVSWQRLHIQHLEQMLCEMKTERRRQQSGRERRGRRATTSDGATPQGTAQEQQQQQQQEPQGGEQGSGQSTADGGRRRSGVHSSSEYDSATAFSTWYGGDAVRRYDRETYNNELYDRSDIESTSAAPSAPSSATAAAATAAAAAVSPSSFAPRAAPSGAAPTASAVTPPRTSLEGRAGPTGPDGQAATAGQEAGAAKRPGWLSVLARLSRANPVPRSSATASTPASSSAASASASASAAATAAAAAETAARMLAATVLARRSTDNGCGSSGGGLSPPQPPSMLRAAQAPQPIAAAERTSPGDRVLPPALAQEQSCGTEGAAHATVVVTLEPESDLERGSLAVRPQSIGAPVLASETEPATALPPGVLADGADETAGAAGAASEQSAAAAEESAPESAPVADDLGRRQAGAEPESPHAPGAEAETAPEQLAAAPVAMAEGEDQAARAAAGAGEGLESGVRSDNEPHVQQAWPEPQLSSPVEARHCLEGLVQPVLQLEPELDLDHEPLPQQGLQAEEQPVLEPGQCVDAQRGLGEAQLQPQSPSGPQPQLHPGGETQQHPEAERQAGPEPQPQVQAVPAPVLEGEPQPGEQAAEPRLAGALEPQPGAQQEWEPERKLVLQEESQLGPQEGKERQPKPDPQPEQDVGPQTEQVLADGAQGPEASSAQTAPEPPLVSVPDLIASWNQLATGGRGAGRKEAGQQEPCGVVGAQPHAEHSIGSADEAAEGALPERAEATGQQAGVSGAEEDAPKQADRAAVEGAVTLVLAEAVPAGAEEEQREEPEEPHALSAPDGAFIGGWASACGGPAVSATEEPAPADVEVSAPALQATASPEVWATAEAVAAEQFQENAGAPVAMEPSLEAAASPPGAAGCIWREQLTSCTALGAPKPESEDGVLMGSAEASPPSAEPDAPAPLAPPADLFELALASAYASEQGEPHLPLPPFEAWGLALATGRASGQLLPLHQRRSTSGTCAPEASAAAPVTRLRAASAPVTSLPALPSPPMSPPAEQGRRRPCPASRIPRPPGPSGPGSTAGVSAGERTSVEGPPHGDPHAAGEPSGERAVRADGPAPPSAPSSPCEPGGGAQAEAAPAWALPPLHPVLAQALPSGPASAPEPLPEAPFPACGPHRLEHALQLDDSEARTEYASADEDRPEPEAQAEAEAEAEVEADEEAEAGAEAEDRAEADEEAEPVEEEAQAGAQAEAEEGAPVHSGPQAAGAEAGLGARGDSLAVELTAAEAQAEADLWAMLCVGRYSWADLAEEELGLPAAKAPEAYPRLNPAAAPFVPSGVLRLTAADLAGPGPGSESDAAADGGARQAQRRSRRQQQSRSAGGEGQPRGRGRREPKQPGPSRQARSAAGGTGAAPGTAAGSKRRGRAGVVS
ncbi:hypothetical protein HYH03_000606 [Edaphochlamys debaryana]|uniref:Poly(A) RNA polymerase mitochondrial-like central palm domain-containing protein n=1 Tax=Edaphochlamys debaryana TaxID=47281 RepID=A0A835YQP3_9CHLO|nr:hypothetical protein HYH03_000606 [Edaphochlamys debaryana]|eukprot:KAG2502114.1 hypothetical protein HYH03_000606 [Edaphochlamys debaryana]